MALKNKIVSILENNRGVALSGEDIATQLNVSRTAVWKAIKTLQNSGYNINAISNKGYILLDNTDVLSPEGIRLAIKNQYKDIDITCVDSTASTNADLMKKAQDEVVNGMTLIAKNQTEGRGRIGRTFVSPDGGIYMSIMLDLNGVKLIDATIITPMAAVAVCRAIEKLTNKEVGIKWVNDIYLNGKKICGILTQAGINFETGNASYAVIGIGINFDTKISSFPSELQDKVGSLFEVNPTITKNELVGAIISEILDLARDLSARDFIKEYSAHSLATGKRISFEINGVKTIGTAIDVDINGGLIVKLENGEKKTLTCGEISIQSVDNGWN